MACGLLHRSASGGDPNIGAIEGEGSLVCFEAPATPVVAAEWLEELRKHTDKPIRCLVLSHEHAVRVLGASAFHPETVVAHEHTCDLIVERGKEDRASEFGSEAARVLAEREVQPGPPRQRGSAPDTAPRGAVAAG